MDTSHPLDYISTAHLASRDTDTGNAVDHAEQIPLTELAQWVTEWVDAMMSLSEINPSHRRQVEQAYTQAALSRVKACHHNRDIAVPASQAIGSMNNHPAWRTRSRLRRITRALAVTCGSKHALVTVRWPTGPDTAPLPEVAL